jgi:putative membrane protein
MKSKKFLWLCTVTSLLLLPLFFPLDHALAQQRENSWGMGHGMMGNWGMGGFGMVFMMIFWVLAIVGVVFLVRWLIQTAGSGKAAGQQRGSGAVEILKARYARGEINKAEFESMKRDII